jgi:hypothetical protein
MGFIIAIGLLLFAAGSSKRSGSPSGGSALGGITYTDSNGVPWRIWNAGPWWTVSTNGYGGRFTRVDGYVSLEQAKSNIDGNAAGRDPATGNIL